MECIRFYNYERGEFSLEPINQEEWNEVIFGAKVIMESTFILNRPDRAKGREDWIRFSELLAPIGKKALEAAESKDSENSSQLVQIYIKHV